MGLLALLAAVPQRDTLGGLLSPFWFGSRETAVTGGGPTEPSLTPLHLAGLLLLNPLDLVIGVSLAGWTVSLDGPRHLH